MQSRAGCYTGPSVCDRVEQGPSVDGSRVRAKRRLLGRRLLFGRMGLQLDRLLTKSSLRLNLVRWSGLYINGSNHLVSDS